MSSSNNRSSEGCRIYVNAPRWHLRPHNTDWRYARLVVPRLSRLLADCTFYPSRSQTHAMRTAFRFGASWVAAKTGRPIISDCSALVDRSDLQRSQCQVLYALGEFPVNAEPTPVIWRQTILDPEMGFANGLDRRRFDEEFKWKSQWFSRSAAVLVSSQAEVERLQQYFPNLNGRFVCVPFFFPDITGISEAAVCAKAAQESGKLRCLFVGNQARRKGLDRVYGALKLLPQTALNRIELKVVSRFDDGPVQVPNLPNVMVLGALPHQQVMHLMSKADVFLMPSRFEGFGFVFIEAMAFGTIPIVPDWEVQREIVNYGEAGVVSTGTEPDLASSLLRLLDDNDGRVALALASRSRFEGFYSAPAVAEKYRHVFRTVAP